MKGASVVAAAALAGGAAAARVHHRHAHAHELFKKGDEGSMCVPECTTIYSTYLGEPTLYFPPAPPAPTDPTNPTPSPILVVVPTPVARTCPTAGVYTVPAETITVSETTTVCGATSTHLPPGTHVIGGVTTSVAEATTITCPVAHVVTNEGVVYSTISETVTFCPSGGTYTVVPITTTVTEECDLWFPTPTSYAPGTYTHPEVVTTITVDSTVFYCPFTSSGLEPEPTPEPVASPPEVPTIAAIPPVVASPPVVVVDIHKPRPKPEPPVVVAPPQTSAPPPAASKPPKTPVPSVPGKLGGGPAWGMTYTPYTSDKESTCKTVQQVDEDIKAIAEGGFKVVRVYSTECDTLPSVGAACRRHGLKMLIGVFIKDDGCSYDAPTVREQVDAILEWAEWDLVDLIVTGNESIGSGKCDAGSLAGLAGLVREKCTGAGYGGPFTVAETVNIWQDPAVAGALCPLVDVCGGNIHPYFNPNTAPSDAGVFTKGQLEILDAICPGKTAINLECGWPTGGSCQGVACPGKAEQAIAISSIIQECGAKTVFFSYSDDQWKEPGACNCENSWGCGALFSDSGFKAQFMG